MNYYRIIVNILLCYIYRCIHIERRRVSEGSPQVDPILECGNKPTFLYYGEEQRDVSAQAECFLILASMLSCVFNNLGRHAVSPCPSLVVYLMYYVCVIVCIVFIYMIFV
jgi:hypothetical protein